mmetsp:Transcript_20456/g.58147  ORF Transcript_20456/g.58147 Transcript_20456/m.58147 type:complete len:208 (-) Transcript_20456:352-975(-)
MMTRTSSCTSPPNSPRSPPATNARLPGFDTTLSPHSVFSVPNCKAMSAITDTCTFCPELPTNKAPSSLVCTVHSTLPGMHTASVVASCSTRFSTSTCRTLWLGRFLTNIRDSMLRRKTSRFCVTSDGWMQYLMNCPIFFLLFWESPSSSIRSLLTSHSYMTASTRSADDWSVRGDCSFRWFCCLPVPMTTMVSAVEIPAEEADTCCC